MTLLETVKDLTIIVGGWWTFYLYKKQATAALNPQLGMSTEVHPYSPNLQALVVRLQLRNVGKVPLTLTNADRLTLAVRRVPQDLPGGYVQTQSLPVVSRSENLLVHWHPEPPYQSRLEPGIETDDTALFILECGNTYHVEATLTFTENNRSAWMGCEATVTISPAPVLQDTLASDR